MYVFVYIVWDVRHEAYSFGCGFFKQIHNMMRANNGGNNTNRHFYALHRYLFLNEILRVSAVYL